MLRFLFFFFFFNDPPTTEIYTLSLHDALPIWNRRTCAGPMADFTSYTTGTASLRDVKRSEEHTSELQSPMYLVCRLLLEKKKKKKKKIENIITQKMFFHRDIEDRISTNI